MMSYRAGYHHGDARAALLRAAFDLARGGGPPTVTLRAAAREVGITAAAVYRHFTTAEELLGEVKCRSLRVLAERLDEAVAALGGEPGRGCDSAAEPGSESDPGSGSEPDPESGLDAKHTLDAFRAIGDAAALRCRIRVLAEAYVSFAREHPGLFAMACHGGVEAAAALVAERVGDVPHATGLAVWSAAHGVAALPAAVADHRRVLDIVLAAF